MENNSYVGLSYQMALQARMDAISNNIANVDTSGFKSNHVLFAEYLSKKNSDKPLSMVSEYGNYRDFAPGALQEIGNPLDVALRGNGFLAIQTLEGIKYTRNGAMQVNNLGQLVNGSNLPYLNASGQPLTIPADAKNIVISKNGTISSDQGTIGQLKVVRFEDPNKLKPVGNSMFETDQDPIPDSTKTQVQQGMIEGSNVNPVTEMTDMIEVMRRYETVARFLQKDGDLQSSMIQRLSRV